MSQIAEQSEVKRRRYERSRPVDKVWDAFRQEWVSADDDEGVNALIHEEKEGSSWVSFEERQKKRKEKVSLRRHAEENVDSSHAEDERSNEVLVVRREEERNRSVDTEKGRSLVLQAAELRAENPGDSWEAFRREEEEARLNREAGRAQIQALVSTRERANNVQCTHSLKTQWRPSDKIERMHQSKAESIRKKYCILTEGDAVPNPIKSFKEMGLPQAMVRELERNGIKKPTPIQIQGLPVALSGRDMIGIAFTGSGKTLTFCLPLIVRALEKGGSIKPGQGPIGLVLCPSRELAKQTRDIIERYCLPYYTHKIRVGLAVGGEEKQAQLNTVRQHGIHCLVATPGRLGDFLMRRDISLQQCEYLCLDEGDRMLDFGFDEEVQKIINHFEDQRQTLLFSATMPQKVRDFAQAALVRPIIINVSRAGAANLDVIQEVEYLQQEAKIVHLLECLQKTAPPVVIFCERKKDVDDIHEYLLLKDIDAVAIHGGKDQRDRYSAFTAFKNSEKDVLVATDVAAKGLDFPDIQHVINFDLPPEIEHYVHRIGRTGRCGKTGLATTFINKSCEPAALLDLKALLIEAKQHIPPALQALDHHPTPSLQAPNLFRLDASKPHSGCAFCGGLGHRITECPKRTKDARKLNADRRDYIAGAGGYGGEY